MTETARKILRTLIGKTLLPVQERLYAPRSLTRKVLLPVQEGKKDLHAQSATFPLIITPTVCYPTAWRYRSSSLMVVGAVTA
jgi:hypothetical protein